MLSAVIYIFFNRPELTRRTFAALRAQRPPRLYLIADGPRPGHATDTARCRETRRIVEGLLDWPCSVTRDYADVNLGCGRRVATGLTAAFALLGEAIVLEDDILAHPDFFRFCDEQLALHRDSPHVHAISGFQPLGRYAPALGVVVPSTFSWIWGWASWQRAWRDYRFDLRHLWPNPKTSVDIRNYLANGLNFQSQCQNFNALAQGTVDTWDFQWSFAQLTRRRVTLVSSVNLITNLGFNADATHTTSPDPYLRDLSTHALVPTRRHRDTAAPDRRHDKLFGKILHTRSALRLRILRGLARYAPFAGRLLPV